MRLRSEIVRLNTLPLFLNAAPLPFFGYHFIFAGDPTAVRLMEYTNRLPSESDGRI